MENKEVLTTEGRQSLLVETALLAGRIVLESGGETFRAEETVVNFCYAGGCKSVSAIAFPTGIMITVNYENDTVSSLKRIEKRGINLAKLSGVNALIRKFIGGDVSLEEAYSELKKLSKLPEEKKSVVLAASALASALFAVLLGGGLFEAAVALVAGILVQLIAFSFKKTSIHGFSFSFVGGAVIAILAVLSIEIFKMGKIEPIITGAIMPILPGLMLTSAIRDTVMGDLVAGTARLVEALLIAVAIAGGVDIVLSFYLSVGGVV